MSDALVDVLGFVVPNWTIAPDVASQRYLLGIPPAFRSDTKVGIEIEVENVRADDIQVNPLLLRVYRNAWDVKDDGSLRNHGMEFATKRGITATEATQALVILDLLFKELYPSIQANARTGVHVHLNFIDKTSRQLGSFIALYGLFENSLFKISGNRKENVFCVPLRESATGVAAALRTIYKNPTELRGILNWATSVPKYCAFNLGALRTFGTVELRQAAGTNTPSTIIPWLHTLVSLADYSAGVDFYNLVKRIKDLNTTSQYLELAREVFPESFFRQISREELIADMQKGCTFVKESLLEGEDQITPGQNTDNDFDLDLPRGFPPRRRVFVDIARADEEIHGEERAADPDFPPIPLTATNRQSLTRNYNLETDEWEIRDTSVPTGGGGFLVRYRLVHGDIAPFWRPTALEEAMVNLENNRRHEEQRQAVAPPPAEARAALRRGPPPPRARGGFLGGGRNRAR